jgi:hypothetical protein
MEKNPDDRFASCRAFAGAFAAAAGGATWVVTWARG